jgi:hypothetical protein
MDPPKTTPGDEPDAIATPVARGDRLGRFIVLRTLGTGGMGMVVSAYDPKLERTVALKVLRPEIGRHEGATGARARLLREAQAMARLRHPNVVTVYEAGEFEGTVFLAMEYVPGGTLDRFTQQWRHEPRGWQRILAAFVEAGRGLAAAHAQGLIHRDFKPTNVLVDGDRVQVTDFGIASVRAGPHRSHGPSTAEVRRDALGDDESGSDPIVGTAPYMAPELHRGGTADERSDQFAFCVALFESLWGKRPFAGHDLESWSRSITDGRLDPPTQPSDVPEWLRIAVMRGLATDPAVRWPSMRALLDLLTSPERAGFGRSTRIAIGVSAATLFVALPFVARELGPPFDRTTHAGAIGQSVALALAVLAMAAAARRNIEASKTNIKTLWAVLVVLVMQIPLELANAAAGVAVATSETQHLVMWAGMAAMYAVLLDLRFAFMAAAYLAFVPAALAWPHRILELLGLANGVLAVFLAVVWGKVDQNPVRHR